jgi:galactonate dehydratase
MRKDIGQVKIYEIDAGWRNWYYLELIAKNGLRGYSEISESNGPKGSLSSITFEILKKLDLSDFTNWNEIKKSIESFNKQGLGGSVSKCSAAIINALIDLNAKNLDSSVLDIFGGPLRRTADTYWSHCGTTRIRSIEFLDKSTNSLKNEKDFEKLGCEVTQSGFNVLKTNLMSLDPLEVVMPSYTSKDLIGINQIDKIIEDTSKILTALSNKGANKIMLDIGYNLTNSSLITFSSILNSHNLRWLEVDFEHLDNIQKFKEVFTFPICSGENYTSYSKYVDLINSGVAETISIDPAWNSAQDVLNIAKYANLHNQDITLHNHYSNMNTYIALTLSRLIDKFSFVEVDVDDVPWKNELINLPEIKDGKFVMEDNHPGWGFNVNFDIIESKLIETYTLDV